MLLGRRAEFIDYPSSVLCRSRGVKAALIHCPPHRYCAFQGSEGCFHTLPQVIVWGACVLIYYPPPVLCLSGERGLLGRRAAAGVETPAHQYSGLPSSSGILTFGGKRTALTHAPPTGTVPFRGAKAARKACGSWRESTYPRVFSNPPTPPHPPVF